MRSKSSRGSFVMAFLDAMKRIVWLGVPARLAEGTRLKDVDFETVRDDAERACTVSWS